MIYMDNAATSFFKPPEIINAAVSTVKFLSVNAGRGSHFMALKGARLIMSVREKTAAFFGAEDPMRVIFTAGCTAALNAAILGSNLSGRHVITTALEHNSVLRPLFELKRRGDISLTVLTPSADGTVSAEDVKQAIRRSTAMVAVTHVSNVTGVCQPVAEIGAVCRKNNVIFLVDAAQSAGLCDINVQADKIDILAVPAHKGLHSLPGAGALILSERASLYPTVFGGTGTASDSLMQPVSVPDGFEAGTLNLPAIAAMGRALDLALRQKSQRRHALEQVSTRLYRQLAALPQIKLYSPPVSPVGIISFNVRGRDSEEVCSILSERYGICVRGGLHCAPLCHKALSTSVRGAVRISPAFNNTPKEADAVAAAVKNIVLQN